MRSFIRLGVAKGQAYAWSRSRMGVWAIAQSPKAYAGGASQIIFCPMNRRIRQPYVRWCERRTGYHLVVSRLLDCRALLFFYRPSCTI